MPKMSRLPAIPLIANDPYFSIWMPGDLPTDTNAVHWAGSEKPVLGLIEVDGTLKRFLGRLVTTAADITALSVTPTQTRFTVEFGGVELNVCFFTPALPDDMDVLSTPITYVDFECRSLDGQTHDVRVELRASEKLCYDGTEYKPIRADVYPDGALNICCVGQKKQNILCHSGDLISIDWGYLFMASRQPVAFRNGCACCDWTLTADDSVQKSYLMLGYDDVASINYFGVPCRPWYARSGKTITDALKEFDARFDELKTACDQLDARLMADALKTGGEDYQKIVSAAWRHTFAAHKLIATPDGQMAFFSKENDSNGCIGTVDVSYPSSPMFLKYCPQLVNALCLPILHFASLPVWSKRDYAPHDVGRYPHATGQVYALKEYYPCGQVYPPFYLYSAEADIYNDREQMPVEECGNLLIMLYAAIRYGADDSLAGAYLPLLKKWVRYLDEYGEDPDEQLCTDDFAGHLAHNVNLAAKAMVGVACYSRLMAHFGDTESAEKWDKRAHEMAENWIARAGNEPHTYLTFDGRGWSMKYNLAWDKALDLNLLPESFYSRETGSYMDRINEFGLPLDSRADYTKSDWMAWCAAMSPDENVRKKLLGSIAHFLECTRSRVAFSDWYDTVTGLHVYFIGRSVQGGMFMPMLTLNK